MRIKELIEFEDFKNIPKAKWTYIDENGVLFTHRTTIRTNNKLSNLRMVSRQENINNSSKIKKSLRRLNKNDIINIYKLRFIEHKSYESISHIYNLSGNSIRSICLGKAYREIYDKEVTNFI